MTSLPARPWIVSASAVPMSVSGPAVPVGTVASAAAGRASAASSDSATSPRRAMDFDMCDTSVFCPGPSGTGPPSPTNL